MAYQDVMDRARNAFQSGKTKSIAFRRRQLEALLRLYEENRDEMAAVLAADLRRPKQEAMILEVDFLINDMTNNLIKLDEWTAVTKVKVATRRFLELQFNFRFSTAREEHCEHHGRRVDLQ